MCLRSVEQHEELRLVACSEVKLDLFVLIAVDYEMLEGGVFACEVLIRFQGLLAAGVPFRSEVND